MKQLKPTYEELESRVIELESRIQRLRNSPFELENDDETVRVPDRFKEIFDNAQDTVKEYFKDIKFQPAQGTIEINKERYVLVRASSLSFEFFNQIIELYSDKGREEAFRIGRNILFDIGHVLGIEDAKRFHEKMDLKDPIGKLSAGPVHFAYAGWAFVDVLPESRPFPDDDFYMKYQHPYSFEADSWIKSGVKSNEPVCIMNAAYSSGWCEESYGLSLTAVEVTCKAKGDENCTFIMAPSHRIKDYVEKEISVDKEEKELDIPSFFERKQMEDQLRENLKEKDILLKEIHHRVKNNLQIISSLLNLQFGNSSDDNILSLLEASKNRIKTMALVHEKLYGTSEFDKVSLKDYLKSILELHLSISKELNIEYKDDLLDSNVKLSIDMAILIGLMVNEMFSNSFKYAFENTQHPIISIETKVEDKFLTLIVADNGRGIDQGVLFPNEDTLGFELINALIEQASGEISLTRKGGTIFEMKFDRDRLN